MTRPLWPTHLADWLAGDEATAVTEALRQPSLLRLLLEAELLGRADEVDDGRGTGGLGG